MHSVITEYRMVDLVGKNRKQRGKDLVSIAHPYHLESF
ncbi:MAG: acetyl-CoA hydrolase/transferase C-terminal domain-containing protein [Chitinophagaceae bacterium]